MQQKIESTQHEKLFLGMDKKFEEFQGIFLFQVNTLQQALETRSAQDDKLITGMEKKLEEFQENFQNQINLIII